MIPNHHHKRQYPHWPEKNVAKKIVTIELLEYLEHLRNRTGAYSRSQTQTLTQTQKVLEKDKERADLLLYNLFKDNQSKHKSGLGYDNFVFLPLCVLSTNARVKLLTPAAKAAGQCIFQYLSRICDIISFEGNVAKPYLLND